MVIAIISAGGAMAFALDYVNVTPRQLGPYIERRADGHSATMVETASWIGRTLNTMDRGVSVPPAKHAWRIGAQPASSPYLSPSASNAGNVILVSTSAELIRAVAQAQAGAVITLMPGKYYFEGDGTLEMRAAGRADAPITVRAERPDTVFIEFNKGEGFLVAAPYWTFENLHIRGVCKQEEFCEHAFHVVGKGAHFTARNNTLVDFNAHFKINGEDNNFPDDGLIEGNTLTNSGPRHTASPVTPIDLVAANHWVISHNLISDFIKADGDRISYGAFVKGAGKDNRIEQNIILCEDQLRNFPGQRVGLSLGGGGTGTPYCRDQRCLTEQDGGVIQSNLIAHCSDDGIYLNRAATSKILHNTLIDTGAISVRFVESSADVEGNLVDSLVHARDGGLLRTDENLITGTNRLFLGSHPVRDLFSDALGLNLGWKKKAPIREAADVFVPDLCSAKPRSSPPAFGAFEDFSACMRQ
jgi:hypothetical protein